ncbi:MAG: NAD-binding protein [Ghiorsea sp.]
MVSSTTANRTRSTDTVILYVLRRMRLPLITLIVVFAVAILGLVLIPGVDADGNTRSMSFFEAFYFISFTATTIGFGELPFTFSSAQRFWVVLMIYPAVISWLYAFGTILTLMQDKTFQQALMESAYSRAVRRIKTPFYLVCGYGETGHILVRSLVKKRQQVVIIDMAQEAINELKIEDLSMFVPALGADASQAEHLVKAGITHPNCAAVIAVTDNNQVNLKIAISSKLLNPQVPLACRAETAPVKSNMASFGTDHIIDAFEIFADRLAMYISSQAHYTLHQLLTYGLSYDADSMPPPQQGLWIICGYGRLGKAIERQLQQQGIVVQIIEPNPELLAPPKSAIIGPATEADPLLQAGIKAAVGIVAATQDDADNLSIVMTARELNPSVFVAARQNVRANDALFSAAAIEMTMQGDKIVAHQALASLSVPLLEHYFRWIKHESTAHVESMTDQLINMLNHDELETWQVEISKKQAPAVLRCLDEGEVIQVNHLLVDAWRPSQAMSTLPLALLRKGSQKAEFTDLSNKKIQQGDQILFCGLYDSALQSSLHQYDALKYLLRYDVAG